MASKSKTSASAMKQGTLSFASSKRGAVATASGKANVLKQTPSIGVIKPPAAEKKAIGQRSVSNDSTESAITVLSTSVPSDDDEVVLSTASTTSAQRGPKRMKISSGVAKPVSKGIKRVSLLDDSSSEDDDAPVTPKGKLQTLEKSGQLTKLYGQAREKNGHLPLSMFISLVVPI